MASVFRTRFPILGREVRVLHHLCSEAFQFVREPYAGCSEGFCRVPETTPQDMKARGGGGDGAGGLLGGLKLGGGGKKGKKAAANDEARDPEQVRAWADAFFLESTRESLNVDACVVCTFRFVNKARKSKASEVDPSRCSCDERLSFRCFHPAATIGCEMPTPIESSLPDEVLAGGWSGFHLQSTATNRRLMMRRPRILQRIFRIIVVVVHGVLPKRENLQKSYDRIFSELIFRIRVQQRTNLPSLLAVRPLHFHFP